MKSAVFLESVRGGPTLYCPDFYHRKIIDGQEFVQVRPLDSQRLNWMNLASLRRVKAPSVINTRL